MNAAGQHACLATVELMAQTAKPSKTHSDIACIARVRVTTLAAELTAVAPKSHWSRRLSWARAVLHACPNSCRSVRVARIRAE